VGVVRQWHVSLTTLQMFSQTDTQTIQTSARISNLPSIRHCLLLRQAPEYTDSNYESLEH
jgi:hypothetical protein